MDFKLKTFGTRFIIICGVISSSIAGENPIRTSSILTNTQTTIGKKCMLPEITPPLKSDTTGKMLPYVGECTEDNNEVCGIAADSGPVLATNGSSVEGDFIAKDSTENITTSTTPEPTSPPPIKYITGQCRCRTEIVDDKRLLLAPDDQNICRGTAGFPCKTYYLGDPKGKHGNDESCLSGICDMELDMCEAVNSTAGRSKNAAVKRHVTISFIAAELLVLLIVMSMLLPFMKY